MSFITVDHVLFWGKERRGANLPPSGALGDRIAQAVFDDVFDTTTAPSLDELRRMMRGIKPDTIIRMWDGGWEDEYHQRWTLGEALDKGRLCFVFDPDGYTHGMHGAFYVD